MNKKILEKILENQKAFKSIFTERQISVINKYIKKKNLTSTEKTYLYTSIKKKVQALSLLHEEFYINGKNMIPKRVEQAKNILKHIDKRAFVSGSFLYSEKHEDIDIFMIAKKRRQFKVDNKHYVLITEKDLQNPLFYSTLLYSVSNFITEIKPSIKRIDYSEILLVYENAVNEILDNDDQKDARRLIFYYNHQAKNKVLDSRELDLEFKKFLTSDQNERIRMVNQMVKEILKKNFSKDYLYNELSSFVKRLRRDIAEYKKNENLIIYKDLFNEVKNECRRTKAET